MVNDEKQAKSNKTPDKIHEEGRRNKGEDNKQKDTDGIQENWKWNIQKVAGEEGHFIAEEEAEGEANESQRETVVGEKRKRKRGKDADVVSKTG